MKNKLLALCMLLAFLVTGVKGQTYEPLTSEKIVYTTSADEFSPEWIAYSDNAGKTPSFKSKDYTAQDEVLASSSKVVPMLHVKTTGERFICFYVKGIISVSAYGVAGNTNRGLAVTAEASDASACPEEASKTVATGSVAVLYPESGYLDPTKSYKITVRAAASDSYLYAVRFVTSSGPSTDNTLHSLTINGENVEIADAMNVSIPYTYANATVPVVFEVDATATVKINDVEATGSVAAPGATSGASIEHKITVTAEDGTSKDYTLTIKREALSNIAALGEVKVGDEIITYPDGVEEYTYPTSFPYGTIEFPMVTATASHGGSVSSIDQATVGNPVATIHILAEDGQTTADYTIKFLIADPIPAKIISEGVVKMWDFTAWSDETKYNLSNDNTVWTYDSTTDRYSNIDAMNGVLVANSVEITETKDLVFANNNGNRTRITLGNSPCLALNSNKVTIQINALSAGQIVRIVSKTGSSSQARGITLTNSSRISGDETSLEKITNLFEVSNDGDAVIGVEATASGGILLYSIEILDLTTQALTAEALSAFTDVELSGDILTADIAILNAADLTSIDLTETSSVASGLNPRNPNCLVYAGEALPGVSNVVVGDAAETIELTDGHDFYNTKAFTAGTIKYTRYLYSGWNTIAFPFPYAISGEQIEEYSSANADMVVFKEAQGVLTANQAYLIRVDTDGDCVFEASSVTVPVTETVGEVFKSNFRSFAMAAGSHLYKLNADGTAFNHSDGTAVIGAFRGYLDLSSLPSDTPNAAPRRIIHGDGGATGIADNSSTAEGTTVYGANGTLIVRTDRAQRMHIYGVDGRMVRIVELEAGENIIGNLSKGVYLAGNQKVVL